MRKLLVYYVTGWNSQLYEEASGNRGKSGLMSARNVSLLAGA